MRRIEIVPYDPHWPALYEQEAARLRTAFGQALLEIHHIGSTAVPGLSAKPIIDIMPVARDLDSVDRVTPAIEALGYEALGENQIPGRRYFRKGGDAHRTHHVHTYTPGHPEIERHLQFRDYLRAHPEEASRYGALKMRLAARLPHDIEGYIAGKDGLVKELIAKANRWAQTMER